MNIVFYTYYKVSPTKGGTERTTISLAAGLKHYYGCRCYSLFVANVDSPMESCFEKEVQWKQLGLNGLSIFLKEYKIDWVVCQGGFGMVQTFRKASENTKCRIAMVHHFEPGWEENFFKRKRLLSSIGKNSNWKHKLKFAIELCFFPFFQKYYNHHLKRNYGMAYNEADVTVLLCKGFISQYQSYANIKDSSKFYVIPNSLSFDETLPLSDIRKKKKIVLIVSRLDEPQKRLSLALKIWKEVKKTPSSNGWILNIVGHGPNENLYRDIIKYEKIPDVYLLGKQQPKSFYKEASIFLMTSKSEGWGLTLTEAQQFGVVPIAFNSYAALEEIVTDGVDGVVIPECDKTMYAQKLLNLMENEEERELMAQNAIKNCKRFSLGKIANKWWILINRDI